MVYIQSLSSFLLGLIVSSLVIYFVTSIFGRGKGIMTAVVAALSGSAIYTLAFMLLSSGLVSTLAGGVVWLLAIKHFYNVGWLRATIIALGIWILTNFVSIFLPTVAGPL